MVCKSCTFGRKKGWETGRGNSEKMGSILMANFVLRFYLDASATDSLARGAAGPMARVNAKKIPDDGSPSASILAIRLNWRFGLLIPRANLKNVSSMLAVPSVHTSSPVSSVLAVQGRSSGRFIPRRVKTLRSRCCGRAPTLTRISTPDSSVRSRSPKN